MKAFIVSSVLLLTTASGSAFASCTGNGMNQTQLGSLLTGRTVCAAVGGDKWQEQHVAGGALIDYKRGPSHPIDPSTQVGTWIIAGNGSNTTVIYSYTGGGSFNYTVHDNGNNTYDFCGARNVLGATVQASGPCP